MPDMCKDVDDSGSGDRSDARNAVDEVRLAIGSPVRRRRVVPTGLFRTQYG